MTQQHTITIKLDTEDREQAKQKARDMGLRLSEVYKQALQRGLKNLKQVQNIEQLNEV
jgi:antitoxin component of RelBE/YafQ-DinJ toxin-antitoxin module